MGMGPTATVGFLDENGKWTPVSATNSLPTTGGGGTDLTSYTQVSSLPDYPTEFPPDVSSISPEDIGAQPAGSYATGAQGALADTAVQPGDLATVATTGAYADLTGTPTIPETPQDTGVVALQPHPDIAADVQSGSSITIRRWGPLVELSITLMLTPGDYTNTVLVELPTGYRSAPGAMFNGVSTPDGTTWAPVIYAAKSVGSPANPGSRIAPLSTGATEEVFALTANWFTTDPFPEE